MHKLDSFAEHVVQVGVHFIVWQSAELTLPRVVELNRSMAASDSESNVSGVDVTATGVHLSPFRDLNLGDEFDGLEISFEAPESRDIQAFLDSQRSPTTPVSSSSDAEVPEISQPASSADFQEDRPKKKRHQRRVPPATKAPGSIGRQARDKTPGGSSVDRMEMGGALDAVLAQDPTGEQEDFGIHSMCSDQASSAYPAVKTPGSSPRGSRQTSWQRSQNHLQVHGWHRTPDCVKAASILKLNTSLRKMLSAVQCLLSSSAGQSH